MKKCPFCAEQIQGEAIMLYEGHLTEHREKYAVTFPGVEVKDA